MFVSQIPLVGWFLKFASRLRFRQLFFLTAGLFLLDLITPDLIPFIDELILGLLALIFASWKKPKNESPAAASGRLVEGEAATRRVNKPSKWQGG